MTELGAEFALVPQVRVKQLERDTFLQVLIFNFVDDAHCALAEAPKHAIAIGD